MSSSEEAVRPQGATRMVGARDLHVEVLDPATRQVWQSVEPISEAEYRVLDVDDSLIRVAIGSGAMDEHWFLRSPGAAEDGPMQEREIGGRRFAYCARPPAEGPTRPAGAEGPNQLMVDKHHVLRFDAGCSVQILSPPDGNEYVHVVEGGPRKPPLALPDGWAVRSIELSTEWIVQLPAPTTAFFFSNRDSFQGPLDAPPPAKTATT